MTWHDIGDVEISALVLLMVMPCHAGRRCSHSLKFIAFSIFHLVDMCFPNISWQCRVSHDMTWHCECWVECSDSTDGYVMSWQTTVRPLSELTQISHINSAWNCGFSNGSEHFLTPHSDFAWLKIPFLLQIHDNAIKVRTRNETDDTLYSLVPKLMVLEWCQRSLFSYCFRSSNLISWMFPKSYPARSFIMVLDAL